MSATAPPRFRVGNTVATRHQVRVEKRLFRRRWLWLLPGTAWTVTAVMEQGRGRPVYRLACAGWSIEREEWKVRPIQQEQRDGRRA